MQEEGPQDPGRRHGETHTSNCNTSMERTCWNPLPAREALRCQVDFQEEDLVAGSGDHWDASLPRSVCTAPTARRASGFETLVLAEPLSHFPKGETTLAKAATLVGDFPAPHVALNPHRPTVALTKPRRKCLSLFCRERLAGKSVAAREGAAAPPASARPAPAAGLVLLPPETSALPEPAAGGGPGEDLAFGSKVSPLLWRTQSAGVGLHRFPPRERARGAGRQGRPSAGPGRPPRCRARGELQPRPRARPQSCFASLR